MLSVHTCPLATLGGKETGGMNVYVRDLSAELARQGLDVIAPRLHRAGEFAVGHQQRRRAVSCLLYTSDAADE